MEQYLSAALLAADVYGAAWPIDCFDNLLNDNPLNEPSVPPCAAGSNPIVEVYSSGLRNLYDFAFHPNGYIYGPDNGLGVTGTYPPTPFVPCFGPASVATNNPGEQPDILLLLEPGMYYGHPNPSRDECVYKNGLLQGVPPLPNYRDPILVLGEHKSANGIVVYANPSAFCGALAGDLLLTNYSVGDDLVRVRLAEDGRSTLGPPVRVLGGFDDPLPIAQSPDGAIFIGEFGGNRISVLVPTDTGCWAFGPSMPQSLLDSSGAALDGYFWVVAGKTGGGPVNSLYFYDPAFGVWGQGPDRPGAAVENPAVVAHDGKLYVIGGSTSPFTGMVATAQTYDPSTGLWASLPPMPTPTPRGGATAQVIGGQIYVVGGLGADGGSVATVEVFDPVANVWSTAPSLQQARDNAGSAAIDGRLYVFGGRLRNANGTTPNGTLDSTEMYDPAFGTWSNRAPMPTGRRTFASVALNGRALALGGEATTTGGAFPQNEEYDPVLDSWRTLAPLPTPRHGCAGAVIDGQVYIAGGGIVAGSSFSNILEIFSFSEQD
jgi:N-acetylneuraminic acid mutarotase